jgi:broad specificity phosphatase PhoE
MLYIMRHGKTEWNKKKKLQGRTDIPLCREGIEMAEKAREEYKDVHLDICYCSPLIRTRGQKCADSNGRQAEGNVLRGI